MLIALAITSFILALLFLIAYTLKNKAKKPAKLIAAMSVLFTAVAVVLVVIFLKQNNIKLFNKLNAYDPVAKYTQSNDSGYAPDTLFTNVDEIYFKNGKGDLFLVKDGVATTQKNKILHFDGKKTITAELNTKGELVLNGHFKYSEFESERHEYNNTVVAKNVTSFSLTDNSLMYITNAGELYALGFNEYGQLGDTTTKNKYEPVLVATDILDCDISDTHSMVIDKYNTLFAVGDNSCSQYGTKTTIASTEFTKIMQGVKDIRLGNYFSLVLAVNGELYTAGDNELGQLGNGGSNKAGLISILKGVKKIDVYNNTCAALTNSGELYVWGDGKQVITTPKKAYENVYDFELFDGGIAVIDNNRNILLDEQTLIKFDAKITDIEPEMSTDAV